MNNHPDKASQFYCVEGYCPPGERPLTPDEAERGHLCDECADELDAIARDAFNRRIFR